MRVFPAPHGSVALIDDHSWGVEMVGMNEVNPDCAGGGGFSDYSHWNIFQPDRFLPDQPVICWRSRGGIISVFSDRLSGRVIEEEMF